MHEKKGGLEVICGSMFSGKSEELIRRLRRAQYAKLNIVVFKHQLDQRTTIEHVASHNGTTISCVPVENVALFLSHVDEKTHVVGIDEIQFFSMEVVNIICTLIEAGKRVIVAGLDLDFKRRPFGPMPVLLSIADHVTKLKAICVDCGNDALFTQRLVNGLPAHFHDSLILVGAQEQYQARCRDCHSIDLQPPF